MRYRLHLRTLILTCTLLSSGFAPAIADAMSYEYDELGRITKVIYDDGSVVVYAYDAAGNRTVVTATKN
jgi:YD repeat-containing protein